MKRKRGEYIIYKKNCVKFCVISHDMSFRQIYAKLFATFTVFQIADSLLMSSVTLKQNFANLQTAYISQHCSTYVLFKEIIVRLFLLVNRVSEIFIFFQKRSNRQIQQRTEIPRPKISGRGAVYQESICSALCGSIPGQQWLDIFRLAQIHLRRSGHQPCQISKWIQLVFHGGLDQREDHRAACRAAGCIGEQEILPVNDEGLYAALSPVVAQFQPAVFQVIE